MPDRDYTLDMVGCARCLGDGHAGVTFRLLTHPVAIGGLEFTHWAPCPTNGEPILMRYTKEPRDTEAHGHRRPDVRR